MTRIMARRMKAATILEQLRVQLPAAYEGLMEIAAAWDTARQAEVLAAVYPTLPKISIDFAVMEKAPAVATFDPASIGRKH